MSAEVYGPVVGLTSVHGYRRGYLCRQMRVYASDVEPCPMTQRSVMWTMAPRLVVAAALTVGSAVVAAGAVSDVAGAGPRAAPDVTWQDCPRYSDEVLRGRGVAEDRIPEFRRLMARTECGTVQVPLDYRDPGGRQISVALTRLPATNRSSRLGSLAVNPGGPGGGGYLMPIDLVMTNSTVARLNDRYDLIGLDPRGVGYSTRVDCPEGEGAGPLAPGPMTEATARAIYDRRVRDNQACGQQDPAFLGELTTANVARDLDQVRSALGERRLGYFGVSWGTWLGVVYRGMFPQTVGRMWLDSVAIPTFRLDTFEDERAKATARNFSRMADWLAQNHDRYALGTTRAAVENTLLGMRRAYDAQPVRFTDLDRPIDGTAIAILAAQDSPVWPLAAQALTELRDADGSTAPPAVKDVFSPEMLPLPIDAPEEFNPTMHQAAFCNEDTGPRDFDSAWAAYQRRLDRYPITGQYSRFAADCAGWPLPVQPTQARRVDTSLQLSGHLYETVSPYEWTRGMQATVGGGVFSVDDDIHGSLILVPDCAARMVTYFETGRPQTGHCLGLPGPSASAPTTRPTVLSPVWPGSRGNTDRTGRRPHA